MVLLLLFTLIGVRGIPCPGGYTDGGDGSCYGAEVYATRGVAYNHCGDDGAYIPDAQNAFQNNLLLQRVGWADVWLGLTCLNNSVTSCQWDTGASMTLKSYNNFDGGRPIVEDGPCVLISYRTGKWYSADCSGRAGALICKYTPDIKVPACDYIDYAFRGKCYNAFTLVNSNDAGFCKSISPGHYTQTSIHSDGENYFFKGLGVQLGLGLTQLLLDIQQNRTWTDGTAVDYENYGYNNSALGDCVSMSLYDDLVPAGMWISSQCSSSSKVVRICERVHEEPAPVSTMAPTQCIGTQFFSGSGTIYSPGYPLGSEPNHCEYLITEDANNQAQIGFSLNLDKNSTIQLFSGLFEQTPFQILTDIHLNYHIYFSSTNVLKVVYETAGSAKYDNLWAGDYGQIMSITPTTTESITPFTTYYGCSNWYYGSGSVKSPNFPDSYPQVTNGCSFYLQSYGPSTCFKFDVFNIRYHDYVHLYDGYPSTSYLFASFTGYDSADGIYCTNHYNWITIVFETYSYNQGHVDGWNGTFAANSEQLLGSTPWY